MAVPGPAAARQAGCSEASPAPELVWDIISMTPFAYRGRPERREYLQRHTPAAKPWHSPCICIAGTPDRGCPGRLRQGSNGPRRPAPAKKCLYFRAYSCIILRFHSG